MDGCMNPGLHANSGNRATAQMQTRGGFQNGSHYTQLSIVRTKTNQKMSGKPAARPSAGGRPAGSRAGGARRATGAARGGAAQQKTNGILSFYQDDSPGLKVGPTTVLVTSLSFVGIVVILHIMGKFLS